MSPHIVECAGGALAVGATAGAEAGVGAAKARVKMRKRDWS